MEASQRRRDKVRHFAVQLAELKKGQGTKLSAGWQLAKPTIQR